MPTVTLEETYHAKNGIVTPHTSGFTAVNGRQPSPPQDIGSNGMAHHGRASPRGHSSTGSPDEMGSASNHREDWRSTTSNGDRPSRGSPPDRKESPLSASGKRKRSVMEDERDTPPNCWTNQVSTSSRAPRHPDAREPELDRLSHNAHDQPRRHDTSSGAERSSNYRPEYVITPNDVEEPWSSRQRTQTYSSEARDAETTFRRDPQGSESQPRMSSGDLSGDRSMGPPPSQSDFDGAEIMHGGVQIADPKKRKRVRYAITNQLLDSG